MITCFGVVSRMGDDNRELAQKRLVTGTSAGDCQPAAIFATIRRREGDAGRVSGASGVMLLEKNSTAPGTCRAGRRRQPAVK
jgi:hypothetical protein